MPTTPAHARTDRGRTQPPRGLGMSFQVHDEVVAARDLHRGRDIVIRRGTPGVITRAVWVLYTVQFRPVDDIDTLVTVRGLRNRDLTPNDAPPIIPTQPDRRET